MNTFLFLKSEVNMFLANLIIYNRAPFEEIKINFCQKGVNVLSGINGRGKTTILSYIADAFYELARRSFCNEFKGKENNYYRVLSPLEILNKNKSSFVYMRFYNNEEKVDYIDIMNKISKEEYEAIITLDNKIPYETVERKFKEDGSTKFVSETNVNKFFYSNILTYFPAYRYEEPGYLSVQKNLQLSFKKGLKFNGYLPNPIEVISDFQQMANWIMDIVLDQELYGNDGQTRPLLISINNILSNMLKYKTNSKVRIGIGPRYHSAERIQIMKICENGDFSLYPSIFNMSDGEKALTSIFCELLRQADEIKKDISYVSGICIIDEVDKHLHIKLQKEVLPSLFKLFPKIQFIVSTHSPFFNLGLEKSEQEFKIFDLDNNGLCCSPCDNDIFKEVYDMLTLKNEKFYDLYKTFEQKVVESERPLIITEGPTDVIHIKTAIKRLNIENLDLDFLEIEDSFGDTKLYTLLENAKNLNSAKKIIGIFDRDNEDILKKLNIKSGNVKEFGNNVYALIIPLLQTEDPSKNISIEHYYKKENLLKEDKNGRRLFMGEEFYNSGNSKDGKYQTQISQLQNKIKVNGVIDDKVYKMQDLAHVNSVALTKRDFANLVANDSEFNSDFDFSNFKFLIDDIINICNERKQ